MQAPSEAPVRKEHQTGGPPLTNQQVCLCLDRFLCTFVYIYFSYLVLEETQIGDPLPPKVHVYLLTLEYKYIYMQPDSEQVVQEEHPIRVAVSEAPGPVITYSRTVSRNFILVLEFEQMYI